jgi:hypothetical protein
MRGDLSPTVGNGKAQNTSDALREILPGELVLNRLSCFQFRFMRDLGGFMAIRFNCLTCNSLLNVDDKYQGKKIKCGKCMTVCVAEAPKAAAPAVVVLAPAPAAPQQAVEGSAATAIQTEPKAPLPGPPGKNAAAPPKGPPPLAKDRFGDDSKRRPESRANRKAASDSSGLMLVGLLLGVGVLGVFLIACIGVVGWALAPRGEAKRDMPIAKVNDLPFGDGDVKKGRAEEKPEKIEEAKKFENWPEENRFPDEKKGIDEQPDPVAPKDIRPVDLPAPVVTDFPPVDPAKLALKPAALEGDKVTRALPATMDDLVVGGGGRYLFFSLPSLKKVGMFDVNEGKVVHYFPAAEGELKITAGLTKLVMAYPTTKVIERWDFLTRKKELTTELLDVGSPRMVLMGSASQGPVLVVGANQDFRGGSSKFLSLGDLKAINLTANAGFGGRGFHPGFTRVSANGAVFGTWDPGSSPQGLQSYVIVGNQLKSHYQHQSMGHITPGPDGKILYTASGRLTHECQPIGGAAENKTDYVIPSVQGNFYVTLQMADRFGGNKNATNNLSLHIGGDSRPLLHVNNVIQTGNDPIGAINRWDREKFGNDKRFVFIPDADLLVVVPFSNDRLELRRVNIGETLEKSGIDYLYVVSRAPDAVQRGTALSYKLSVKSKKGGLKYKLDAGPAGMKISKTGVVVWKVDADHPIGEESVLLTVSDSADQEVFHSFKVRVVADEVPQAKEAPPKDLKFDDPPKKDPIGKGFDPLKGGALVFGNIKPVKLNAERVERMLPASLSDIVVGGGGRFLLVTIPSLRKLGLFDANEGKLVHYFPLAGDNARVAAGREHLFIAYPEANILQRWNLYTRQKELTVAAPFQQAIESLTMGYDSHGPILAALRSQQVGLGGGFKFFDQKFKLVDVAFGQGNFERPGGQPVFIHASPDGTLFGCRDGVGGEPHRVNVLKVTGNTGKAEIAWIGSSTLVPSPDGRFIYSGSGIYTPQMKLIYPEKEQTSFAKPYLPALHGPYFLRLDAKKWNEHGGSIAVFFQGNYTPFATINDIDGVINEQIGYGTNRDSLTYSKRVFLIPSANLLVSVPKTNDRLVLHQIDMNKLMEQAPIDYLIVASSPPTQIARGQKLVYKLDVRSKKGGLRFNLDAGPQGMTISPQGEITWSAPPDHPLGDENIILTVRDSAGQEVFHTFRLSVRDATQRPD